MKELPPIPIILLTLQHL